MADTISSGAWLDSLSKAARSMVVIDIDGQAVEFHIRKLRPAEFLRIFKGLFARMDALEQKGEDVVDVEAIRAKMHGKEADWIDNLSLIRDVVKLCVLTDEEDALLFHSEESLDVVPLPVVARLGREILTFSGFNMQEAELARSFRGTAQ